MYVVPVNPIKLLTCPLQQKGDTKHLSISEKQTNFFLKPCVRVYVVFAHAWNGLKPADGSGNLAIGFKSYTISHSQICLLSKMFSKLRFLRKTTDMWM